jgi:hypothetical protein
LAALVQPNGKIVVVGDAQIGGEDGVLRFGIVRYFGGY